MAERDLDLVLFGASGFTGGLVARYLARRLGETGLRWGLAARKVEDLEPVRDRIGAPADLPLLTADAGDDASLDRLAARAGGIITTVGPYQKHGAGLVAACAKAGTDYADLCGEPAWMRAMIDTHDGAARAAGASILFSCGYDSIPFDLGVFCLQRAARKRFGTALSKVEGRVRATKGGGFSGGTAASLGATNEAAERNPAIARLMADPFALCPGFTGPDQPAGDTVTYDEAARSWAAPFVMATINTKNVHRTNLLLHHVYGADFCYDEMTLTGDGAEGEAKARATAERTRQAMSKHRQGSGSSEEDRQGGFFDLLFHGATADGRALKGSMRSDHDPGYTATSMMIAETAILQREVRDRLPGVSTPTATFGGALIDRLAGRDVMRFTVED